MVDFREQKVVAKAFEINIKLTFPGTNPTNEQIKAWWASERKWDLPCSQP